MKNDVNQLKEEVKELRGYIEKIVGILELSYKHISSISNSCNCLKEDLEIAITSNLLEKENTYDSNENQYQ